VHAFRHLTAAVSAAAILSGSAAGQASVRPTVGVSGGLAIPTGSFGQTFSSGYDIGVLLGIKPAASPVGLRFEGAYQRYDAKGTNPLGIHTNIISGTANAVIGRPAAAGSISPYLIGGVGIYNVKVTASQAPNNSSDTKFGLNIGAGIDLPLSGIAVFFEARYHYILLNSGNSFGGGSNLGVVPIVVGVRF
jgi:opacity protein-like surface antigen